jgi:hypothetical protein
MRKKTRNARDVKYRLPRTGGGGCGYRLRSFLAFSPKAANVHAPAGLLTYSPGFAGLPIRKDSDAWWRKAKNELTAAGTVQDLHLIPF